MRCTCGGEMTLIYRDVVRPAAPGHKVRVEHVPHLICLRCGEAFVTPETERRIAEAVSFALQRGVAVLA